MVDIQMNSTQAVPDCNPKRALGNHHKIRKSVADLNCREDILADHMRTMFRFARPSQTTCYLSEYPENGWSCRNLNKLTLKIAGLAEKIVT